MIFYTLGIRLLAILYRLAVPFNLKAKQFVRGRKNLFEKLSARFTGNSYKIIWVHCASLGEFEQGRPIIELIKKQRTDIKIFLTFFSPSGYEIRKNYEGADFIYYLPWDTRKNAEKFIAITKPSLAIFVKYEFWYNYSNELKKKNIPLVSASCILRPNQVFFKPYGGLFRKILKNFTAYYVQNLETKKLLASIGIPSTIAGDTRFDRVLQIIANAKEVPLAKAFKNESQLWVIGSCWPEDLEVLSSFIHDHSYHLKFIIAPHEINEKFIVEIERSLQVKTIRFSKASFDNVADASVMIIDNIGMLSTLYRYGEVAFVGGAFGDGLHNILEAACYGVPIFFGDKNYEKFQEAHDLIMRGGAFEVSGYSDLKSKYELLNNKPENYLLACEVTKSYVEENRGATIKIVDYCLKLV
ncbi:MAG: 3-deoxy-D-manno-octulosonic acid transferase [Chryseotalea sp. WA131a]|nr:MAG: 3-deoxy-D-manno-octulosonic acid transferase [Chryseotalea sp. WA131a]